jgi:predicted enzyme related to lactoylglutathione lyase
MHTGAAIAKPCDADQSIRSKETALMKNPIHWFEIPVADFERALRFYQAVFAVELRIEAMPEVKLAIFPYAGDATGGALCLNPHFRPSADGVVVYLEGGDDLAVPLARVAAAGGTVVMAKTLIAPEIGYMAFFIDSEGNRIGLHSTG